MADYEGSYEYEGMKKSMEAFSKEVARLQDEREIYGRICDATIKRTNALAVDACGSVKSFASLMSLMQDADDSVRMQNDTELEREGFTREDAESGMVPAYVEERLYAEHEPDYYSVIAGNAFEDLYEAAYAADSVLTDETKKMLGPEYEAYVREMQDDEPEAADGSRRLPDVPGNVICDPETGIMHSSLTDVYGNPVDDDFAFDEPD